jgi:H+/Cl- antiporter ClcA
MLPLDSSWYRKLLGYALVFGLAAGSLAVVYMGVTGAGSDVFFGDAESDWWSGEWWWIPLIALGGVIVAWLRQVLSVDDEVPGAIAYAQKAWVEPASAPRLVAVAVVSAIFGASLGPSFGLVIMGGGLGSWIASRLDKDEQTDEARHEYTLTGMTGALGGAFSAPIFGAVLASELSPTSKRQMVTAFIPELIAATFGFIVFFGVTGTSMLDSYELPPYKFEFGDLLLGALLGALSVVVILTFAVVDKIVSLGAARVTQPLLRGLVGGGLVGLIAVAMPLSLTSGSSQLATLTDDVATLGAGFLAAVIIAKMLAIAISLSAGFLGGTVFPMIFLGGASGVLVHVLIPDIPAALTVGAMLAAVPGSVVEAPLSMILISAGAVGLTGAAIPPVGVAVITAYLIVSAIKAIIATRQTASAETG